MSVFLAPAKLNLFLHVVGRRPDGYHLLQTAFVFLDYYDELEFAVRADGCVARTNDTPGVAAQSDLAVRAALLLQQETGCKFGVNITLRKRIPMGAGLGGGSSDAATTLIALNRMWQLKLSRNDLQMLALRLGADVPVFVFGRPAFAEGVGERLTPLSVEPAWYLVLTPDVHVSTQEIFQQPNLTRNTIPIKIAVFSPMDGHNDLQPVVCERYPEVKAQLQWLERQAPARMTGSGSSVFARFASKDAAERVWQGKPPQWRGFIARSLTRHPHWEL